MDPSKLDADEHSEDVHRCIGSEDIPGSDGMLATGSTCAECSERRTKAQAADSTNSIEGRSPVHHGVEVMDREHGVGCRHDRYLIDFTRPSTAFPSSMRMRGRGISHKRTGKEKGNEGDRR